MKMIIASAQYPITQFSKYSDWVSHAHHWVKEAVSKKAELLLFPEYGAMELTSLLKTEEQKSLSAQLQGLQPLLNEFKKTFADLATKYQCLIVAPSFPIFNDSLYINRAFIFYPDGKILSQDKQIMTRFENEEWGISPGDPLLNVFDYKGIRFGINICYDGEFPIFAQKQSLKGMQLLLHPSCTEGLAGMERVHVGARARALENQIYVVVSQTIGDAPWSIAVDINNGKAAFYSTCDHLFPTNGILQMGEHNIPKWIIQELDFSLIDEIRKTGQVFNFKDIEKSLNR